MDPFAGMLAAALVLACHVTANLCVAGGLSAAVVLAVHVFGWAAQVFGHAVFEGRAPALVDSPFQVRSFFPRRLVLAGYSLQRFGGGHTVCPYPPHVLSAPTLGFSAYGSRVLSLAVSW